MKKVNNEKFMADIKCWLDNHIDEYDSFIQEMNSKSLEGLFKIYWLGNKISPELMQKAKLANHGDIVMDESQFENFLGNASLGETLAREFYAADKSSILPAVLAWMHYGKCWEMIVSKLESRIIEAGFLERSVFKMLIKYLIWGTVFKKVRTREDWKRWKEEQKAAREGTLIDTIVDEALGEEQKAAREGTHIDTTVDEALGEEQKAAREGTVIDAIVDEALGKDDNQPKEISINAASKDLKDILIDNEEELVRRIKERISLQHTGPDIAHLYLALRKAQLLVKCEAATFHRLLCKALPNIDLKGERNFQKSVKKLTETSNGKYIYEIGEDKKAIESWIGYLKDETSDTEGLQKEPTEVAQSTEGVQKEVTGNRSQDN